MDVGRSQDTEADGCLYNSRVTIPDKSLFFHSCTALNPNLEDIAELPALLLHNRPNDQETKSREAMASEDNTAAELRHFLRHLLVALFSLQDKAVKWTLLSPQTS
ncbi:Hypothetical predicted protein [Pelobates cultripes]|uniref:Uncharacterized protein n=1 Tax=Pelobates cultripes TaxID=61616 RepID=A0AAD1VTF8_PELCU|nr:Hypothetical predicted protein [Pelobates cultripes]